MKIQCDVCHKQQASLFCTADEAALCSACDHRVHHANNLASKHHRFSLNDANFPKNLPLCDICHERKGFVFCQEDRAIVCKECDLKIHAANEHKKEHNRFLLSGIELLSPAHPAINKDSLVITNNEEAGSFTISEHLINTIPGWKFEDFIDSSSSVGEDTTMLVHHDQENVLVSFSGGMLVPQAPHSSFYYYSENMYSRSSETIKEANPLQLFSSTTTTSFGDHHFMKVPSDNNKSSQINKYIY